MNKIYLLTAMLLVAAAAMAGDFDPDRQHILSESHFSQ